MKLRRYHRRTFLGHSVGAILLAATGRSIYAHAKLLKSEPRNGSTLHAAPKQLELWFNELLDEDFNQAELFPAKQVAQKPRPNLLEDKPRLDPKDRTHLSVNLPPLKPDTYTIEFRVLSRDGHTAPGRITFTVVGK